MPDDLDLRTLRHFIAVAEELHFSRAAQRLYVAQQALSRDIRRLEDRLGVRLLERSTRRVSLTPAGDIMLRRAREMLAIFDATVRQVRGEPSSLTVDVAGADLTGARVLDRARELAPEVEFFARFHSGAQAALPALTAARLDVSFGRELGNADGVRSRLVRFEPMSVLIPVGHPLAELDQVPLNSLKNSRVCIRAGDHATAAWEDAVLQLLAPFGVDPAGSHPHVHGADELARHIRERNAPILTLSSQPPVPQAVLRPVVQPVPLFPWAMLWRDGIEHAGLRALHRAIDEHADWRRIPSGSWLPEPEASAPDLAAAV